MTPIQPNALLSEQQAKEILAALALAGLDQQAFADAQRLSYWRVNRMIKRREVVTPDYARRFNTLVQRQFRPYATATAA